MKTIFYIIISLVIIGNIYGQNAIMHIKFSDGTQVSIPVEDIKKMDFSGEPTAIEVEKLNKVMKSFSLLQNYPNPFNPTTKINYFLPKSGPVNVVIYNIVGQKIKEYNFNFQKSGDHQITWDAKNENGHAVPTGLYIYSARFKNKILSKKMLLIK